MIQSTELLLCLTIMLSSTMFCNYYPMDAKACISKTDGIQCYFNEFENACLPTRETSHGCINTLNKLSCLNQLTQNDGTEATCIFTNRCQKAKKQHFKNLGCALNYSQYACMNAQKSDCIWNDKCEQFLDQISQEDECSKVFKNRSVTPSLCQKIQNIRCMSNGFYGQYKCVQITEQMLMSMECSQLGLNEQGCIEIITIDQACIFENNQCKQIENAQNCNLKLNRLGCLTIMNPNIKCQWKNNKCLDMTEITLQCDQIYDVNPSVCQSFKGICQYDKIKKKCRLPTNTELQHLKCNTDGLTKQACLQIKNQYCTFFRGICEELSQIDLQQFQCKMELNEDACINITTQFQYCQWDGLQCKRISINQQTDCPLLINNHLTKFNGNVCQSITKPNVQCKYNAERHLCEISNQLDSCNTPYLNLQGCLNLIQIGITCQWSNEKCINIKIINNKTTCNSLKFVNPIACSQVFESNSLGCYFDSILMQCKSINIQNSNNEEKEFLYNTDCSNPLFGLNKVACASIMKPGQICRWTQNQCSQIKSKEQISQVQCISLQYVNQQVCALVEFMKEPCRYSQQELGCVNSIVNGMQCEEIGLNTYACAIASKNCYFDTEANQCKRLIDTQKSLLSIIKCDQNSPTIGLCSAITTYNQLCTWSYRANKCQSIDIPYNSKCLDFSGKNVIVNINVCASIEHEFPEYDYTKGEINKQDLNRGLCKFNIKKGVCEKLNQFCTTPCCTENDKIGINAHSCSRYSNPSFFCYFSHNLRCTQLTNKQISIINDETAAAYYNYNKFKCSQMTVKSCSRINWSTKQRCYNNGRLCLNVNFNNYLQFDQFLIANAVNEYACLAIEAIINENNNKKYFQYDKSIRKCNSVTPNYSNSCQIPGNRNICLTFTKEKYCKWNVLTLKCEDMTDDEFDQIISCNSNQNVKACIENNNLACQFFEKSDSCIDTYPNEDCLLYDGTLGKVSKKVCTQIIKDGQMCKFQDNKCIQFNDSITNGCEHDGINSLACYNLTTLECRWDVTTQTCYQNYSKIDDLRCEDNLNKILCIKVTKEPCIWDNQRFKCLKLIQTSQIFFSSLNQNNQYNELTCHLIQNSYEYQVPKCVLITEKNNNCSKQYINKYACLYNTQGYHCYYDPNEIILNLRCKQFIGEQTQCTTTILINIQICMEIPKSCYFDSVKQICTPVDIDEQVLCSDLMNDQTRNYNYLSCASISENLTQTYGPNQCYENKNQVQTCNYEKYCFWNSSTYNCQIKQLHSLKWVPKQEGCSSDDPDCKDKCSGNIKEYVNECSYRYSKALCLEMNQKQCFFDINQGGCNEIQKNEIYIGDCDNLYQYTENDTTFNNCNKSMNQNAICVSELGQDNPQGCQSFKRTIFKCVQLEISNDNICDTSTSSPSPGLCSIATTFCRFDKENQKCTSNQSCDCDGSFSQSMCESCNCNFEQLGYCQSKDIMINAPKITTIEITIESISQIEIKTNKYYLCNQVNLLKTSQPEILCSNVEQSCMYNDTCIDVTGYQCNELMNNIVSSKACTQCKGDKMYYDSDHFCKILNPQNTPNLDSLNQASCVSSHFDKPLQWDQSKCKEVSDIITLSDCSLYNPKACKDIQQCWIHPETNLCTIFNENIGNCEQQYTQEYCLLSNKEMCYWNQDDKVCRKAQEKQSNYVCEDANKFGCLNLENQLCVWSNTQKCQSIKQIDLSVQSCTDFLTQKYDFYNGSICTLLVVPIDVKDKSCFRDSNYQCRSSIITDKLQCDTSGLNEYSCINSTIGKCKFSNSICSYENSQILDCEQDDILLNLNSCLNQKKTCKFEAGKCQTYEVNRLEDIEVDNILYSISVCSQLDSLPTTPSFIYNSKTKRCINIQNRSPYIHDCNLLGMNKNACLQKTKVFCRYTQQQCQSISFQELSTINSCDQTLNQFSCISLSILCKYQDGKCQNLDSTENCQFLSTNNTKIKASICSKQTDQVCFYDQNRNQCQTTQAINLTCSTEGLNQKGCLFNTKGLFCKFDNGQCQDILEEANCDELINEDKCLSIMRQGQYCQFNQITGCRVINHENLKQCGVFNEQTNPVVCSLAIDKACYYDIETKKCKEYDKQNIENNVWEDNHISYNQLTCEQYNKSNKMLRWDNNECQEIVQSNLSIITCDDNLNQLSCQKVNNINQNCQYINNKCQHQIIPNNNDIICNTIKNINTGYLCEKAKDKPCKFNKEQFQCEIVTNDEIINCADITNGYNQIACDQNQDCEFDSDYHCYQKKENEIILCKDAITFEQCQKVRDQGCYFNNGCKKIIDYSIIECMETINAYGCQRVSKEGVYCKYFDQQCQVQNPLLIQDIKCKDVGIINNLVFCEQVNDEECRYDQKKRSCDLINNTNNLKQFKCERGLNLYSCLNRTIESLQCKFEHYCYGPNDQILNCKNDQNILDCCTQAYTKDQCLFQSKFKCKWLNEQCSRYDQNQSNCDQIQLASKSVCNSILNVNCILDYKLYECNIIDIIQCEQAQSKLQCRLIQIIPCYWDQMIDKCIFKQKLESDQCNDIKEQSGNIRACMDIEKKGQFCQFKQNQCEIFEESETITRCLNNINKISCIIQVQTECIWMYKSIQIKNIQSNSNFELSIGECQEFHDFNTTDCNDQLSYLSCLKIITTGIQCQWIDQTCQKINSQLGQVITPKSFILINSNACGLVNNGDLVQYNSYTNSCMIVTDINNLTCSPMIPGLNKQACVRIQNQMCIWDDKKKQCIFKSNRLLMQESQSQIQYSNTCNSFRLNKQDCLQSKIDPCVWILESDNQYTCQEYHPYSLCKDIKLNVNSIVCSLVIDDPCLYNSKSNSCEQPNSILSSCDIEGINALACSAIQGCIFKDYKCQIYNPDKQQFCHEIKQANYQVCSLAIDNCKYSELHHGCISSSNFDYCSTIGLSPKGCNLLNECQWTNSKCECLAYIQRYPKCSTLQDQILCQNVEYCFFEVINMHDVIIMGKCREKRCSDLNINNCEGTQISNKICYLNNSYQCHEATNCNNLIKQQYKCTNYKFNNIKCIPNKQQIGCESLNCNLLDQITCLSYPDECIYIDICKTKTCQHMNKTQCLLNECEWDYQTSKCNQQRYCSQIQSKNECQINIFQGIQCTWINLSNQIEQCTPLTCRYLDQKHCNGSYIGKNVCVQMKDYSCVSCEEITDICLCLNQYTYCTFSYQQNQCISKSCNQYQEQDCPQTFCRFNISQNICQPLCQNYYNEYQCNKTKTCIWDQKGLNCVDIFLSAFQLIQLITVMLFFVN